MLAAHPHLVRNHSASTFAHLLRAPHCSRCMGMYLQTKQAKNYSPLEAYIESVGGEQKLGSK